MDWQLKCALAGLKGVMKRLKLGLFNVGASVCVLQQVALKDNLSMTICILNVVILKAVEEMLTSHLHWETL